MQFGQRSKDNLATCHSDLQKIMYLAISRSDVDFGVHQGERSIETQQEYYDNGKSKVNPKAYSTPQALAAKGSHITIEGDPKYSKSRACDFHISEKYKGQSLAWDQNHLAYVAGVIVSCAKELYQVGEVKHQIRWGADWDRDGIIAIDHTLKDFPHVELILV